MSQARRKMPAGILAAGFPSKRDEAVLNASGVRVESVLYDFAADGGAVGSIEFGRNLPSGAVITRVFSDELTALTSGGAATVQLKAGSTNLIDATAFDTGFTGAIDSQALASSAEGIKISSESELQIAIATAALTAGKVRFYIEYMLLND